jgi:hypothetical protein|eukprot:COSAG06_NODE_770_length_12437_cov_27.452423_5_plen_92_part_00
MNGCLHGRWVLGVAHNNPAFPSTVVGAQPSSASCWLQRSTFLLHKTIPQRVLFRRRSVPMMKPPQLVCTWLRQKLLLIRVSQQLRCVSNAG